MQQSCKAVGPAAAHVTKNVGRALHGASALQAARCGPAGSGTHNAEHFIAMASLSAQDADADTGADVPQAQCAVLQAAAC